MALRTYHSIYPQLGAGCYVDESSVIVGDVILEDDASIWPLVAARGDVNKIRIGQRSNIQDGSVLHVTRKSQAETNALSGHFSDYCFWKYDFLLKKCSKSDD